MPRNVILYHIFRARAQARAPSRASIPTPTTPFLSHPSFPTTPVRHIATEPTPSKPSGLEPDGPLTEAEEVYFLQQKELQHLAEAGSKLNELMRSIEQTSRMGAEAIDASTPANDFVVSAVSATERGDEESGTSTGNNNNNSSTSSTKKRKKPRVKKDLSPPSDAPRTQAPPSVQQEGEEAQPTNTTTNLHEPSSPTPLIPKYTLLPHKRTSARLAASSSAVLKSLARLELHLQDLAREHFPPTNGVAATASGTTAPRHVWRHEGVERETAGLRRDEKLALLRRWRHMEEGQLGRLSKLAELFKRNVRDAISSGGKGGGGGGEEGPSSLRANVDVRKRAAVPGRKRARRAMAKPRPAATPSLAESRRSHGETRAKLSLSQLQAKLASTIPDANK